MLEGRPNVFEGPEARAHGIKRRLRQFAVATAASLSGLAAGMSLSFELWGLMQLEKETNEDFTPFTIFLLLVSLTVGAIVGAVLASLVAHFKGRKPAVVMLAAPFVFSTIVLYFSFSIELLHCARFCAGLGVGGVFAIIPVYVSEVADDSVRGSLGSLLSIMFNTGILLAFLSNMADKFIALNNCCLIVTLIFFGAALWMPETPQFLYSQGRLEEAECSLRWLRGKHCKWLKEMQEAADAPRKKIPWRELLSDRCTRRPLGISLGLVILQQLTEVRDNAFPEAILAEDASLYLLPSSVTSVTFEWTSLVTSLIAMFVVDKAKRKLLLATSSFMMAVCLLVMAVLYYLRDYHDVELGMFAWLPFGCGLIFTIMFNMGMGPLPWVVMAELLPPGAKSVACSLVSAVSLISAPVSSFIYNKLIHFGGGVCSNVVFSILCVFCGLYVIFVVPETKDKTFEEIQRELSWPLETQV